MEQVILTSEDIGRIIERLSFEIIERHADCENVMILGIHRRGVEIARRVHKHICDKLAIKLPFGTLDINLYRDDWTSLHGVPNIGTSSIPTPIEDKKIILVDDVLFTGRTIRAALEAILDYGRPKKVELLALVDRGHRELPIHADYVGRKIESNLTDRVDVLLSEYDEQEQVKLVSA